MCSMGEGDGEDTKVSGLTLRRNFCSSVGASKLVERPASQAVWEPADMVFLPTEP